MERKFDIKTSLFRLPQGTSPSDNENIALVKRIYKSATGAENIQVKLHQGPNGELLTDLYEITLEYPTVLADGQYVSLKQGALEGQAADLLGKIIKALATGADASAEIQKLLEVSKAGGEHQDPMKPEEGSATGPTTTPPGVPSKAGPAGPSVGPSSGPSGPSGLDEKKKNPFASKASRNSKLKRAMLLESKLRIPLKDGLKLASKIRTDNFEFFVNRVIAVRETPELGLDTQGALSLVNMVDNTSSWKDFYKKASRMILDENDKPLPANEYAQIAKIARGEEKAPLV